MLYACVLMLVIARAAFAQEPPASGAATPSRGPGEAPPHDESVDFVAGVGSTQRNVMVGVEGTYRDGTAFIAARYARDPDLGKYTESFLQTPTFHPDVERQEYYVDFVTGITGAIGPVRLEFDGGVEVAGLLRERFAGYDTVVKAYSYTVARVPTVGAVLGVGCTLPLGDRFAVGARGQLHYNLDKAFFGVTLDARITLARWSKVGDRGVSAATRRERAIAAHRILYGELSTSVVASALSINYEHMVTNHLTMRLGYGVGYIPGNLAGGIFDSGSAIMGMMNYLSNAESGLEVGGGISLLTVKTARYDDGTRPLLARPSFVLGFRSCSQPGGFLFRIGLSWVYYFGAGLHLGLGHAF